MKFYPYKNFWRKKKVFITGHTGFKGSWLSLWLHKLDATVKGYSLEPPTEPSMYSLLRLENLFESVRGDVLNRELLEHELSTFKPEIVIHLAAQSLVIDSYDYSYETFQTNSLGTASLLEAAKKSNSVKTVLVITSDKCYQITNSNLPHEESDRLGGDDPYSASKAAAEIIANSYRNSFFEPSGVSLATVRTGNVFGGGDWSDNRLVPDAIRAFRENKMLIVRNPGSTRPWQFVLEPLLGYLMLARASYKDISFATAWNFGPDHNEKQSVAQLADLLANCWSESSQWVKDVNEPGYKESIHLLLNSDNARKRLGWKPFLTIEEAVGLTVEWYKSAPGELLSLTERQIERFEERLQKEGSKKITTQPF